LGLKARESRELCGAVLREIAERHGIVKPLGYFCSSLRRPEAEYFFTHFSEASLYFSRISSPPIASTAFLSKPEWARKFLWSGEPILAGTPTASRERLLL